MPTRRSRRSTASPKISATQISPERSGRSSMPDIQKATIDRAVIDAAHAHLDLPVARGVPPHRGLLLADDEPVLERLLADRAADRAGEAAALDARDPQRFVVQVGAPQRLVGRDAEVQGSPSRIDHVAADPARELQCGQVVREPDVGIEGLAGELLVEVGARRGHLRFVAGRCRDPAAIAASGRGRSCGAQAAVRRGSSCRSGRRFVAGGGRWSSGGRRADVDVGFGDDGHAVTRSAWCRRAGRARGVAWCCRGGRGVARSRGWWLARVGGLTVVGVCSGRWCTTSGCGGHSRGGRWSGWCARRWTRRGCGRLGSGGRGRSRSCGRSAGARCRARGAGCPGTTGRC